MLAKSYVGVKKYVTSPDAEMFGGALQAFTNNLNAELRRPLLDKVLEKYGLDEIDADGWLPTQFALDFYKLLSEEGDEVFDLVAIGMQFVETAPYPPEVNSIETAMKALNEGYKMSIRNYPPEEGYTVEVLGPNHVRVVDHCPYPHDIMYGYIYGLTKRFRPENAIYRVRRTFIDEANPDESGAIYDITWE